MLPKEPTTHLLQPDSSVLADARREVDAGVAGNEVARPVPLRNRNNLPSHRVKLLRRLPPRRAPSPCLPRRDLLKEQ